MNLYITDIEFKVKYLDKLEGIELKDVWVIYGPITAWGKTLESALENYKIELSDYYEIMDK